MTITLSHTVSSGTFSIGIAYQYKDDKHELYIKPQYDNFKEEIRHYKYLSMEQYQQEILPKAKAFFQTEIVRKLHHPQYGPISIDRLISIILYTDYTSLSSHFTATFRKK